MSLARLALLIAFVVALAAVTLEVQAKSFDLTASNFDTEIAGKNALVMFKAPWCGHCKAMTPAFDELAKEFNTGASTLIAHVDCTVHGDLCQKFGVSGYPTLKAFPAGNTAGIAYEGGRDLNALKSYVQKHFVPKCDSAHPEGCDSRALEYLKKMKEVSQQELEAAYKRLEGMKAGHMTAELKAWLVQRMQILKSLIDGEVKKA